MINHINGILEHIIGNQVTIDVSGIGYGVKVPTSVLAKLPKIGEKIKLYTAMIVREDSQVLYGFLTIEEKNLFNLLLTASGIGPKMALSLMSAIEMGKLVAAVTKGNVDLITSVPGIGLKTAQRLVIELKEKLAKTFGISSSGPTLNLPGESGIIRDSISALMALGYTPREAQAALSKIDLSKEPGIEEVIRQALKSIK